MEATEVTIQIAGILLSKIKIEVRRQFYLNQLKKQKILGIDIINLIKERIVAEEDKKINHKSVDYSSNEQTDILRYGIYTRHNVYWKQNGEKSYPLTNFIIIPLYHVGSREQPSRMVKITNGKISHILNIPTDDFVDFRSFQRHIEGLGNFMFTFSCKVEDWVRIKQKIYAESTTVYRISTLGTHRKGFFTWSNGIGVNGDFFECDSNGVVSHQDTKFLIPGFDIEADNNNYDDDAVTDEHIQLFKYNDNECIDFKDWTNLFLLVFKENGLMGIAYYLASCYRDIIYLRFRSFPNLFLFGPTGKGKSTLAWSMRSMYGMARKPMILGSATKSAFSRQFQQVRNGIVWGDEYHNNLEMDWIKLMMNVYDGGGRELANIKGAKSTDSTQVSSAFIISGQDLPTKEIALLTRCITLYFNYISDSETDNYFDQLKRIEETGVLSQITNKIQKYRDNIQRDFDRTYDDIKSKLRQKIDKNITARTLQNHLIPLTVVKILSNLLKFQNIKVNGEEIDFYTCLESYTITLMKKQSEAISTQDELASFWKIFVFLYMQKEISHDVDFRVENQSGLSLKVNGQRTGSEKIVFDEEKRILFVRLNQLHSLYVKQAKIEGLISFNRQVLQTYFEQSEEYIGIIKAKRFENNNSLTSCIAFRMDILQEERGIDLQLTKIALNEQ